MPALSSAQQASALGSLVARNVSDNITAAGEALQVVCAWPVSGQYGPGSRFLYYVLIAACVLARKVTWIQNACLAGALILPAVAAIHGIFLAVLHVDEAVDMDVYGAFQLCAIGILAAPVTLFLSNTYFNAPGRNTIFLWAGLILAGEHSLLAVSQMSSPSADRLLSLTVEFYRIETHSCPQDNDGRPVSRDITRFPYDNATCGLTCSVAAGPFSPMRGGAASDIHVIPAPDRLTFGTATLLAAACCVHAIVWLVSMMDKILEVNLQLRRDQDGIDEPIEGTNGATRGTMRSVNNTVRFFLGVAVVPVFGGAGVALLVAGESNFFSPQVMYQNESMASISQWAPIAGTGLAAVGSLYLLLASDVTAVRREAKPSPRTRDSRDIDGSVVETPGATGSPAMRPSVPNDLAPAISRHVSVAASNQVRQPDTAADSGSRRKVAKMLIAVGNSLGAKAQHVLDDSEFKLGAAGDYPEVPGEDNRNRLLDEIRDRYNPRRHADGNATPLPRSRSRDGSFDGSVVSTQGVERVPRAASQRPSPFLESAAVRTRRASTMPPGRASFELQAVDPDVRAAASEAGHSRGSVAGAS
ncbi:Uncharacterized protein TPAR_03390 [Tolypocladium paradoxum]|uniref:Transmembrane protein n=1 Tax=Tolypocladium paradoxum TaxID=94208 RepID=A0A2S4L1V1_9HYPO|nr:Uncharacterized protein TPAR_03390 [Tolypocladium paradoxum]